MIIQSQMYYSRKIIKIVKKGAKTENERRERKKRVQFDDDKNRSKLNYNKQDGIENLNKKIF